MSDIYSGLYNKFFDADQSKLLKQVILIGYKKGENSIFESTKAETDLVNRLLLHNQEVHTIEIV